MDQGEPVAEDVVIRRVVAGEEDLVMQAGDLFDNPPQLHWVTRFLAEPTHHLLMAYRGDVVLGFVSAVEMTHPDKGTEMFIYELAVGDEHRRQGVARALLGDLTALAQHHGCNGMWVLTDDDNTAAVRTYRSSGGTPEGEHLMLTWEWQARVEV